MTNDEFAAWREKHFRSKLAASEFLQLDRDTITALESGRTKKGEPYPVRRHISLMCAFVELVGIEVDAAQAREATVRRALS